MLINCMIITFKDLSGKLNKINRLKEMSSVQLFWKNTLKETYTEVKKARDAKETHLNRDCYAKNKNSEEGFSQCLKGFYDEFSKFQLKVEFEQRKVFECLQELKKGGNVNAEVQKMCLKGTEEKLANHLNNYKAKIALI